MKIKWTLSDKRPFKAGDKVLLNTDMEKNLIFNLGEFKGKFQDVFTVKEVRIQKTILGRKIPEAERTQYLTLEGFKENIGYPAKYFIHKP